MLDPRFEAIVDFFPIEDGHAQERSALDELLETVQRNDLWVGDRNFCTLKLLYSISTAKAAFVIRHHKKLEGLGLSKRKKVGKCDTGVIYERTMKLPPYEGRRMTVRRIEIDLKTPTRDGDTTLVILTNLPRKAANAFKIVEVYRNHWKIETAFQTLTVALNCEVKTLCYPKAALFVFALVLVAYNAIAVVEAAIAREHGRQESELMSHYYMALEISQATDGMLIALPAENWLELATLPLSDYTAALCDIAKGIDLSVYRKSIRARKKQNQRRSTKRGKSMYPLQKYSPNDTLSVHVERAGRETLVFGASSKVSRPALSVCTASFKTPAGLSQWY